jgi:tetratricopeptide (TPR) repeat protein
MTSDLNHLRERRDSVRRDIEELALQVDEGEVDPETAERLRTSYERELDALNASLGERGDEMPAAPPRPAEPEPILEPEPIPEPREGRARSTNRAVTGGVLLLGALAVIMYFAVQSAEPDDAPPGGAATGDLIVDPATVSNEELEAVVAANPDVTAMRMALADRYFEAEAYGASLDHYLNIAENSSDPRERSKALARVGWMAYITDQAEAADEYLVRSLEADPTNSEAILYRGFVTLYGLEDAEAALPQLEAAQQLTNISQGVIDQIDDALEDARRGTP